MTIYKNKIWLSFALFAMALTAKAQSSVNSPYTRYGLGDLSKQTTASSAAMGGVGIANRNAAHINLLNPAAYSAVDSLTFMFDAGLSLKRTQYIENSFKVSANNSSVDYLSFLFRLRKNLGISSGFMPYSTVGYNFTYTNPVSGLSSVTSSNTLVGDGGLQQVYIGLGYQVVPRLSVGFNVGYLYGTIDHTNTLTFSNSADRTIITNSLKINSYTLQFGAQYTQPIDKDNTVTLGATMSVGHKVNATATHAVVLTDGKNYSDYTENTKTETSGGYSIPYTYGVGVSWSHKKRWTIEANYSSSLWKNATFAHEKKTYLNSNRVGVGAEFLPNIISRNYLSRIRYRVGAYYATPYITTTTGDGPKEYGVSAGFGLPLTANFRNSMLSITGQYVRVSPSATNLMAENRFEIKIGLTFNERWFMKWKIQ